MSFTLDEETCPSFFDKDVEDMDIFTFIQIPNPTKVKIAEQERIEGEPRFLETTVGRIVPLLPVAPGRGEREIEASIDKLFDEGSSVIEVVDVATEDVALAQPRRQKKRKTLVADAGGPSHPPKKLREDHRTPSRPSVTCKSRSTVQRLLAGAVLNAEVRGELIPTLPFVTSSVSATPEYSSHHSGANATEAEVNYLVRSTLPLMTIVTTVIPLVDSAVVTKEKTVKPSLFGTDSSSASKTDPTSGGFSSRTGSDFLVGGIRTVIDPDSDLQKVYIPQWNVMNRSHLDDGGVFREMVDEFAPSKFFASVCGMKHDQLFREFNVRAARQMSLSAEVRMRAEYNIRGKRRLKSVVEEKDELLKTRDEEIENLKANMSLKEAEAAEAICLSAEASKFKIVEKSLRDEVNALVEHNTILEKERNALDVKVADLEASVISKERELTDSNAQLTSVKSQNGNLIDQVSSSRLKEKLSNYENLTERLEEFQDAQLKIVNDKFDKLYADFVYMALYLEEKFYPHLLTTISCRRWLLTHGMELAICKCLNSPEYLSALGAAIGKAIEKGMQDGLSAGITHGKEGRVLTDVVAYNPSAEVDYVSSLQQLQNVNLSLLAELKTNKDASFKILINILRLEENLAERLGLSESQPHVDQLMVPIHHSPDKTVVGASALSLALGVSDARPFSATVVTGTEGTSDDVPAIVGTTATLSITFAFSSTFTPISVDDYEVTSTDDPTAANENVADENANPFPNVDDAELNIPQ
ncbi:hypothetical protein Tco_0224127 [Tanacetum coccineum]